MPSRNCATRRTRRRETLGKGHNFRAIARRIENDLLPRWGATDITKLTEHDLNDWIADDYRVEDTEATVARYGRQPRGKDRQKVWKKPGVTTLGNLDWALLPCLAWRRSPTRSSIVAIDR